MTNDRQSSDDRSPMTRAFETANEVLSACFMMVLPGVGGHYLDKYLQTSIAFTLVGVALGLVIGIQQIIKIVNRPNPN